MQKRHPLCFQFDRSNRTSGHLLRSITAKATDNSGNAASNTTSSAPIQLTVTAGVAQVYYIHTDQLNTPRLITNAANAKVWEWNSDDPFANNVPNDDPNNTGNHFTYNPRLPGQYFDSETNTHYNYYRDYDPATGRYVESDPIGLAGGINTYGYVGGNPIGAVDPEGLAEFPRRKTPLTTNFPTNYTPKLPVNQCPPNDCKTLFYHKFPLTCPGLGKPKILWIGTCSPYVVYEPEDCLIYTQGSGIRG